jgi:ribosome-associated heat shock protein Hsp15
LAKSDRDDEQDEPATAAGTQRLDKWLWYARVLKTRTQAAGLVSEGKVRVNRQKADKPAQLVRKGDVLTISLYSSVRILEVVAPGDRRGNATAAAALFVDLTPPPPPRPEAGTLDPSDQGRDAGSGRPTKRDRRLIDRLMERDDD